MFSPCLSVLPSKALVPIQNAQAPEFTMHQFIFYSVFIGVQKLLMFIASLPDKANFTYLGPIGYGKFFYGSAVVGFRDKAGLNQMVSTSV